MFCKVGWMGWRAGKLHCGRQTDMFGLCDMQKCCLSLGNLRNIQIVVEGGHKRAESMTLFVHEAFIIEG